MITQPAPGMPLQGPIIVVSEIAGSDLTATLDGAGAFPVIEMTSADAPAAIATIGPIAVLLADAEAMTAGAIARITGSIKRAPYVPVLASHGCDAALRARWALPIAPGAPGSAVVARLKSALRVRALHAKILRQAGGMGLDGQELMTQFAEDPLDDASVLIVGRGPAYPALSVALGAQVGVVGALSLEAAAKHLQMRDVDGIVIGDGFERALVDDFLDMLGADPRFRDLPIAAFALSAAIDPKRLPNFERLSGDASSAGLRPLPLVRLHAFSARLKRIAATLDTSGSLDPDTGLMTMDAFRKDLERAIQDSEQQGGLLAVARFAFGESDRRVLPDAARIVARLVRDADFAARDPDGGILVALAEADIASARNVARRISSVLKHTALMPGTQRGVDPLVSLTTVTAHDAAEKLLARLRSTAVAAE